MTMNKVSAIVLAVLMAVVALLADPEIQAALHLSPTIVQALSSLAMLVVGILRPIVAKAVGPATPPLPPA